MENYLFYSILSIGISYFLYHIFLKKELSLTFNRFYLLGSLVICLVAPTLHFDFLMGIPEIPEMKISGWDTAAFESETETIIGEKVQEVKRDRNIIPQVVLWVYLIVSFLFLLRFVKNLLNILVQIKRNCSLEVKGLRVIPVEERGNPYSFFHYLFVNRTDFENKNISASVLEHESAHSRQYHSADILLVEFICCFFWFNPFLWFYKKAVVTNHEYLADAAVIAGGIDIKNYSDQLIQSGNKTQHLPLISGFNFIQTKNRLLMLHRNQSSATVRAAKILTVLTLFAAVFIFTSFNSKSTGEPFVVVVDAGHGGIDPGNLGEKEINLQIAKQLKALSDEREIKIILIREKDEQIPLNKRVDFVNAQKADMLLSIHCNAAQNLKKRGTETFYSKENKFSEISFNYSKALSEKLIETTEKGEIKTANFKLLKQSEIPSVLIELGFLTNTTDRILLNSPEYQKKIAEELYAGLLEIKSRR